MEGIPHSVLNDRQLAACGGGRRRLRRRLPPPPLNPLKALSFRCHMCGREISQLLSVSSEKIVKRKHYSKLGYVYDSQGAKPLLSGFFYQQHLKKRSLTPKGLIFNLFIALAIILKHYTTIITAKKSAIDFRMS